MGPGPFAVWQMVDYPNKRTNYLGFPSVPGHCWEQQEGPATRPANSGSAGTEGCSHSSSVSLPGVFIFPPLSLSFPFFTVSSHSILSPTWQSQHKHILEGFCFNTVLLLCLGGDCFAALIWGWFKVKSADGSYFDWYHLPLLLPAGSGAIMMRRLTNGPCSTRTYCRKNNTNNLVCAISSTVAHFKQRRVQG